MVTRGVGGAGVAVRTWRAAVALGGLAILAGLVTLGGWVLDVEAMASWSATKIAVQPNTALSAIVLGTGVCLLGLGRRWGAMVCGGVVAAFGVVNLLQHFAGVHLGIDRLLLLGRAWGSEGTVTPGRPGIPASTGFVLLGLGLVCGGNGVRWWGRAAAVLAVLAAGLAFLSLNGHVTGALALYGLPKVTAIAFPTTVMLLLVACGLMASMPGRAPVALLLERGPGGMLARRALPLVVALPAAVGWFRAKGFEAGLYDTNFGTAARTVVEVGILCGLLWWAVLMLRKHHGALVESEELNRRVIESTNDCIKVLDLAGGLVSMNEPGQRLLGIKDVRGLVGRPWAEFWPEETRGSVRAAIERALRGEVGEFSAFLPTLRGEARWWDVSVAPIRGRDGRVERLLAISRDVTARRREDEARASLVAVLAASDDAILSKTLEGTILSWNPGAERMLGYSAAEAVGKSISLVVPAEQVEEERGILERLRGGERVEAYETVRVGKGGKRVHVSLALSPLMDASGRVVGASSVARDVSQKRREEEARAALVAILATTTDAILSKSLEGVILSWNAGAERLLGFTAAEAVGRSIELVVPPEFLYEEREILERLRRGDRIAHYETVRMAKGGKRVSVSLSVSPVMDDSGRIIAAASVARDITLQKRAEEELRAHRERLEQLVGERTRELEASHRKLRAAERMVSLGTLSAGLGHDMGNLLIPIRLRIESLRQAVLSEQSKEDVEAIRTCEAYLRRLASGLRLLSLDAGKSADEVTELSDWWQEVQGVMGSVLPRGVALEPAVGVASCRVRMSRAGLTQAVFNLVQNAGDAMRERGFGRVVVSWVGEGAWARVRVSDDGPGMSEEVRARCMEPYFTTKAREISTGLGLSLVAGLVRDAGGSVEVETEEGAGTAFTLVLRRAEGAAAVVVARGLTRAALVDVKDARLRSIVTRELAVLGFEVDGSSGTAVAVAVVDDAGRVGAFGAEVCVVVLGQGEAVGANVRMVGEKPAASELRRVLKEVSEGCGEATAAG